MAIWIFLACLSAYGRTITVSKTGSIQSIRTAVELASPGDTIIVQPGVYKDGNIVIQKSLSIVGESYPVLDGEDKYEILTIHANNVTIQGFKFARTGIASIQDLAGIKVLDSKYLRLVNNQFEDTFFGIHISNSSHCWMRTDDW